jgi:hypothetical protein
MVVGQAGRMTMRQPGDLRRLQQPVLNVIGMLGAAGTSKIGYAGLAVETIMTLLMIYVSVSLMLRKVVFWVAGATERGGSIVFRSATRFRRVSAMGA